MLDFLNFWATSVWTSDTMVCIYCTPTFAWPLIFSVDKDSKESPSILYSTTLSCILRDCCWLKVLLPPCVRSPLPSSPSPPYPPPTSLAARTRRESCLPNWCWRLLRTWWARNRLSRVRPLLNTRQFQPFKTGAMVTCKTMWAIRWRTARKPGQRAPGQQRVKASPVESVCVGEEY